MFANRGYVFLALQEILPQRRGPQGQAISAAWLLSGLAAERAAVGAVLGGAFHHARISVTSFPDGVAALPVVVR